MQLGYFSLQVRPFRKGERKERNASIVFLSSQKLGMKMRRFYDLTAGSWSNILALLCRLSGSERERLTTNKLRTTKRSTCKHIQDLTLYVDVSNATVALYFHLFFSGWNSSQSKIV